MMLASLYKRKLIKFRLNFHAVLNVGTASQLGLIKPAGTLELKGKHTLPPSVMEVPYFESHSLIVAASLTGANAFATLVETTLGWMEELGVSKDAIPPKTDVYKKVIQLAGAKMDTSLQIGVTLWGERHRPEVRGSVANVTPSNLSIGDIGSAVFRGIIENLQTMMPQELFQMLKVRV